MFNLQQFIADHVICRPTSMFAADIEANKETLQAEIRNKSVCVIGGAGSIGSSFIKAVLPFKPSKLIVIDLNENGLAELTRDLRSTLQLNKKLFIEALQLIEAFYMCHFCFEARLEYHPIAHQPHRTERTVGCRL